MSSLSTSRKNARLTRAGNILARLGFGAFATPVAADEPNLDYAYAGVLAGSGGKFTDSVERDAGLRLRSQGF